MRISQNKSLSPTADHDMIFWVIKMFENLFPSAYEKNAYRIDYRDYFGRGYRGLIFDIDNTLVGDNAPADERSRSLVDSLKELGYRVVIVSNNCEERVKTFADALGASYVFKADKPSKKGYLEAAKKMGCKRDEVLVVGDQLFTDIWGANNAGIMSVLVKPIDKKEEIQIILKRIAERIILRSYRRYCKTLS